MLTQSHAEGQSSMNTEWISKVYQLNQPRPLDISLGTVGTTMLFLKVHHLLKDSEEWPGGQQGLPREHDGQAVVSRGGGRRSLRSAEHREP